jgi:hypothetical protein
MTFHQGSILIPRSCTINPFETQFQAWMCHGDDDEDDDDDENNNNNEE